MRRFVLLLMLVLLPLRGWVGEAMAMDMLAQHASTPLSTAIQNIATHAHEISAEATFYTKVQTDCHGAAEAPPSETSSPHCGTCPLCQMCHTVAAPPPFATLPAPWLPHAQPCTGPARFASAPAAFALKPPIS